MVISVSGNTNRRTVLLVMTIVLVAGMASPGDSLARQKRPTVYNVCACACSDPTTGFGELLPDIQNTAGVSCEVYNNRTCSLDGGTRTGTTKYCGDISRAEPGRC
jgi:hypothetical protein